MNRVSVFSAVGLAGILCLSAGNVRADLEVSAAISIHAPADFDAPLAACGTWVTVGSYGRCWRPAGVAVSWQPYCNGQWVWTDCGWYWESDEPWAWACYHYGYWVYDPTYGWVWIPGVDWAPAWVCWRIGGGCIGWAPLCPPGFFFARQPIDSAFVFVDNDHFGAHIGPSVIVHGNRHNLIQRTKFISNVRFTSRDVDGAHVRRVAFNEGPGLDAIEKATHRQFKAVDMNTAVRRTPRPTRFNTPNPNQHLGNNPPVKPKYNQSPDKRYSDQGPPPNEAQPGPGQGGNQGGDRGQGGEPDGGPDRGHDRGNN